MPQYLVRCRYMPEAWKGLVANPEDRTALAKKVCENFGGKLHHPYFAFGEHDLIEIIEAPDNKIMMAIMMASAASGSLADVTTTVLMSAADARTRILTPGTVRSMALVLCVTGIVGMIVTSIADSVDGAIAFGFVGATGALALLLVGVLVPAVEAASSWDEAQAAEVEDAIRRLVATGADEDDIRTTVRAAIRLGRRSAGD